MFDHAFNPALSQFAPTPFGRTGPLDVAARRVLKASQRLGFEGRSASTAIMLGVTMSLMVAGLIVWVILALLDFAGLPFPQMSEVQSERFERGFVGLYLTALAAGPLTRAFWHIRRLHDLNRSGFELFWPILFGAMRIGVPVGVIALGLSPQIAEWLTGIPEPDDLQVLAAISLAPVLWYLYERYIYALHRWRWRRDVVQAPSDLGNNRHGPGSHYV